MESQNDTNEPAIRTQNLRKSFGEQVVLNGVSLAVPRGKTLMVLGRSGTGKSVLLKLLIGLQKPDQGEIEVNGKRVTGLPLNELNEMRKKMGFLFQNAALYDSLTVEENVAFPLRRHTKMNGNERKDRVRELLAEYSRHEDLISIGAYQRGSNPRVDEAIARHDQIIQYLRQDRDDAVAIGRMRNRSAPGAITKRNRMVVSHTTTTSSSRRAINACSSGGHSNSRNAPSDPTAKDAVQARPNPRRSATARSLS